MNFLKRDAVDRWLWKEINKSGLSSLINYAEIVGIIYSIRRFMEHETIRFKFDDNQ